MLEHHRVRWGFSSAVLFVVSSAAALADDIYVPRDHGTIEEALAAAAPGDRVIVLGGKYENVIVTRGDIEIIAKGAMIRDTLEIAGSRVSVSGFRLDRRADVLITGDDVTLTGIKASGGYYWHNIMVDGGRRATIAGNKLSQGIIQVPHGADATITGNRLKSGTIDTSDVGAAILSNSVPTIDVSGDQASVLDNRCRSLGLSGDSCDVANNRVLKELGIHGDSALATGNVVFGSISVHADDVTIAGNDVTIAGTGVAAIEVRGGSRGTITGNVITHRGGFGIEGRWRSDGLTIIGNDIHGFASRTSIAIGGDGITIANNTIVQTDAADGKGNGIEISGDANVVTGNDIGAVTRDAIVVVSGTGTVVSDERIDAAPGCGLVVTCRASGTIVAGCSVSGCVFGIVNDGTATSVTDTTTQDNRSADILDLSDGFSTFEDNAYTTISHDPQLAPTIATTIQPLSVPITIQSPHYAD
jgi:hypothetical protein